MNKTVLASASCYTQLYYLNSEFESLPTDIRNELRYICIPLAEKLHGIFTIGFYDDSSIYIEASGEEVDYDFDDIGSQLEIKKLQNDNKEFFRTLSLWYIVYKTKDGENLKEKLIKSKKEN